MPSDDNSKLIELVEKTKVSGGGFSLSWMQMEHTLLIHQKGESDSYVLSLLQGDRGFLNTKIHRGKIFVSKEFIQSEISILLLQFQKGYNEFTKAFGELLCF